MTRTSSSLCLLTLLTLLTLLGVGPGRAAAQEAPEASAARTIAATAAPTAPTAPRPVASLVMLPTVAAAIGPTWSLVPSASTALAVDVTVGAAIGWPGRVRRAPQSPAEAPPQNEERYLKAALWLQPEFGYSYQHGSGDDPRTRGHLGSLGLGLGYGSLLFATVAYAPRLVVGELGNTLAMGLRHGVSAHFLGRLFAVELSHQMLRTAGELRHELRLLFGLNAGALLVGWL